MKWELYGWYLLVVGILGVVMAAQGQKPMTTQELILAQMLRVAIFMPLIGHLLGWW